MTADTPAGKSFPWLAVLPLFLFLGLAGVFYSLLSTEGRDTSVLPSALLNEPSPRMIVPELPGLEVDGIQVPGMGGETFSGKLSVVNVFASWCVPCRQEHPQIVSMGELEKVQVVGINHRDSNRNALAFLDELGNPYDVVGVDRRGRASIEWGVYGVPETFLVDENGIIFYKHIGPISEKQLDDIFMPLLEQKLTGFK
ncbi:MAG: DsbE family thiol:disulfide interchange protein [Pseudomonadota bacterium]